MYVIFHNKRNRYYDIYIYSIIYIYIYYLQAVTDNKHVGLKHVYTYIYVYIYDIHAVLDYRTSKQANNVCKQLCFWLLTLFNPTCILYVYHASYVYIFFKNTSIRQRIWKYKHILCIYKYCIYNDIRTERVSD